MPAMDLQMVALTEGMAGSVEASQALLADASRSERMRRRIQPVHMANVFYAGRHREAHPLSLRPPVPLPHQSNEYTLMCAPRSPSKAPRTGQSSANDGPNGLGRCAARRPLRVRGRHNGAGYLDLFGGRFADAQRWLAEAEAQLERRDAVGALIAARLLWATAAAETDDLDIAAALQTKVDTTGPGR